MSTFSGKMMEIPEVAIDQFECQNFESEAFFLSHCHEDHMRGLCEPAFHEKLLQDNIKLYLSHVSACIVRNYYPNISRQLKEMDVHSPTTIELKNKKFISVTAIPAGHCPGSIMFLFETNRTRVLYTGDFRINPEDLRKFRAFYNSFNQLKIIDKIYLDTTFFLKQYQKFPARHESLNEMCSIIESWLKASTKHVIQILTSAKYGYEYLFIEIYNKFKMPIHVNDEVYYFYCLMPNMDSAVTQDPDLTRIHCACGLDYTKICRPYRNSRVKTIKVSAFRWNNEVLDQKGISDNATGTHMICYSTHASYGEGVELIKFLKPKEVEPNVVYGDNVQKTEEIYLNIREALKIYQKPEVTIEKRAAKRKFFDVQTKIERSSEAEASSQFMGELNILDSPPRM